MEKLIYVLITIIPIIYQIQGMKNTNIDLIQYIPMFCINVVLIIYFYRKRISISKHYIKVAIILTITIIGMPIITFNINSTYFINSLLYSLLYLNFIIFIILLSNYMVNGMYFKVIKCFCIGNSVILIINIASNLVNISFENLFINIFGIFNDIKIVESFGYKHPNLAAIYILIQILLIYLYFNNRKLTVKISIFILTIIICLIICLILTGSRTAIICLAIFIIFKSIYMIFNKIDKRLQITIITLVISIAGIILFNFNFDNLNFVESINIRIKSIKDIINYIRYNGNIFIGIGPSSVSQIALYTLGIGAPDNGFIVILIQYGIVGLVSILGCILYLFKFNKNNLNNINMTICLLFYSLTENVLFVPGVLISLIVWILIITDNNKSNGLKNILL